ncbi:MAG: tetratricopeptide repeat protein [Anaerolineae bacterium]|nr:tetratricopeptide repeat protein [Anaerolineae bacterium]MDW8071040.1 tetratricopeptide repeat protein [Anaerolineae bacterium]
MAGNREAYAYWMRQAIAHSQRADWAAAAEAYRRALTEFPTNLAATIGLGKAWMELGQLQFALKACERAVQLAPRDHLALASLADVQERLGLLSEAAATYGILAKIATQEGNLQAAADAWMRASRLAPERTEAYRQLAYTLERLGRLRQAAAEYVSLGAIYERRREWDAARTCYQEALRLDSENNTARARLQALQPAVQISGKPLSSAAADRAIRDTAELLALDLNEDRDTAKRDDPFERARRMALQQLADSVFVTEGKSTSDWDLLQLITRGIERQMRGQLHEAVEIFHKILETGYSHPALSFNLGVLYYEQHQYQSAVEPFRRSMRDQVFTLGAHYALGLTYWAAGVTDQALEHFLEVARMVDLTTVTPDRIERVNQAYQQLRDRYLAHLDGRDAEVFVKTFTRFFSQPGWEPLAQQARRNMDRLTNEEAPKTLAEYLRSPETGVIVDTLALVDELEEHRMLATAAEQCLYAISRAPDYLPLYLRLAELQAAQGYHEHASALYMNVVETLRVRGELQRALQICRDVLAQWPMDVRIRAQLIRLLLEQGAIEEALEQYLILADSYYQLAEVDRALEQYEAALRIVTRSPEQTKWEVQILRRMGDIFVQRMEWERATWAYESILTLLPSDEAAQLRLVDLHFKQRRSSTALQVLDRLCQLYYRQGKVEAIYTVLRDLVHTYPDEIGLRARAAEIYAAQGLTQQAIAEYTVLSRLQLQAGLRDSARQTLETILKLGPEQPETYRRLLARLHNERGTTAS